MNKQTKEKIKYNIALIILAMFAGVTITTVGYSMFTEPIVAIVLGLCFLVGLLIWSITTIDIYRQEHLTEKKKEF